MIVVPLQILAVESARARSIAISVVTTNARRRTHRRFVFARHPQHAFAIDREAPVLQLGCDSPIAIGRRFQSLPSVSAEEIKPVL